MRQGRTAFIFITGVIFFACLFILLLLTGPMKLSPEEIFSVIFGGSVESPYAKTIVLESRLPAAIGAACCGAMLSVAGLIMQTLFHNPMAGPSVLGISSGASFGVALFMLSAGGFTTSWLWSEGWIAYVNIIAALGGAFLTIIILIGFSSAIKSNVTLLIVGIMLSYLFSSCISLLNYFSKADEIRSFLVWGLGSFSGLRFDSSIIMLVITLALTSPAILFTKQLNAMLLGERYLESVGYSVKRTRTLLLIFTGILVAVPTAFCGPIGFIGLIVPHLCRLLLRSSNHIVLIPASILIGAIVTMLCALVGNLPTSSLGVLPINVITPFIGVPVILYLLVRRNKVLF